LRRAQNLRLGAPGTNCPFPNIRETFYGVADKQTLEQIGAELSKDRNVRVDAAGVLHSVDDSGIALGSRSLSVVAIQRPCSASIVRVSLPSAADVIAADHNMPIMPRTLSHVVYFRADVHKAERFYVDRLQFRLVDRFTTAGPFLRPAGTL